MVSYDLPIHFKAVNATEKGKLQVLNLNFLFTTWYKNVHTSFTFGPITPKILSSRHFDSADKIRTSYSK